MVDAVIWLWIGFAGQALFFARFLVQWIASERRRASVIPTAFWFFSLGGGLILLAYAVHRRDPVFIAGQATGLLIYVRNLWLIFRRRDAAAEAAPPVAAPGPAAARVFAAARSWPRRASAALARPRRWRDAALVALAAALLYLPALGAHDLWNPDEARYAEVAREMIERGDYLVPHLNGAVYSEKPPLLFWSIAAASIPGVR